MIDWSGGGTGICTTLVTTFEDLNLSFSLSPPLFCSELSFEYRKTNDSK